MYASAIVHFAGTDDLACRQPVIFEGISSKDRPAARGIVLNKDWDQSLEDASELCEVSVLSAGFSFEESDSVSSLKM